MILQWLYRVVVADAAAAQCRCGTVGAPILEPDVLAGAC